jgi:site-specific DNA-methyltransferase (adenine-specific)
MSGIERIVSGDALKELPELPGDFAHAVVTDPPYGLAFMGRDWDRFSAAEYQDWCRQWAEEAYRVLKPGGHLMAFSSNRTHHRLFSGVENAGFEIRDTVTWHYGNGFPKHTDMFLKPATEFVVLARRRFDGSAADCFEEHGTAYLNVDACRVSSEGRPERTQKEGETERNSLEAAEDGTLQSSGEATGTTIEGRYPANLVFDESVADELDAGIGELSSGGTPAQRDGIGSDRVYNSATGQEELGERVKPNSGGPSRYFYTSKATEAERTLNGQIENGHPTVKPADLMEWLVALVSREGQVVVDPFCGTGTTCKAAKELGREWLGIEQNPKWADVARVRCGFSPNDPSHVRGDNDQSGLEGFLARPDGRNDCSIDTKIDRGGGDS